MTAPLSREKVRELAEGITPQEVAKGSYWWVDADAAIAALPDLLATADHLYAEVETARRVVERLRAGWFVMYGPGDEVWWAHAYLAEERATEAEVAYLTEPDGGSRPEHAAS